MREEEKFKVDRMARDLEIKWTENLRQVSPSPFPPTSFKGKKSIMYNVLAKAVSFFSFIHFHVTELKYVFVSLSSSQAGM